MKSLRDLKIVSCPRSIAPLNRPGFTGGYLV
jgi:hypothetical protein